MLHRRNQGNMIMEANNQLLTFTISVSLHSRTHCERSGIISPSRCGHSVDFLPLGTTQNISVGWNGMLA